MEQLPRLEGRIESISELRELMQAMRAMAASHVQEGQRALDGIRTYAGIIEGAIGEGLQLLPEDHMIASPPAEDTKMVVAICSEHGFVGAFNEHLVGRALLELQTGFRIGVIGRRGAVQLAERGLQPAWSMPMATHASGVLSVARRIAERLAGVSVVQVIFAGYRSGARYEVESRPVLPVDPTLFRNNGSRPPPLHHLSATVLLERLADEYLLAELSRAVMESFVSENGARLLIMDSADRNIESRLAHLEAQVRRLRQEAVTSELLDLMTGAEAILEGGHV